MTNKLEAFRERVLDLGYQYWPSALLHAAVRLGMLEALSSGQKSTAQIARQCGLDARAAGLALNALASLGFVRKQGAKFSNFPAGKKVFIPGNDHYAGDILRHHALGWESWGRLDRTLRSGRSAGLPAFFSQGYKAVEGFILAMDNTAKGHAGKLAEKVSLKKCRSLLDVGGGSAAYSIAFLKKNPHLRATLFDLPLTVKVARKLIREAGLLKRFDFQSGDFLERPFEGTYDAVFLSHILHGLNEKDNRKLLKKILRVLNPGGLLIIQDFFLDEDCASPSFAALFSLNMLIHTQGGRSYSAGETRRMLRELGFVRPVQRFLGLPRDISVVLAKRKRPA